MIPLEILFVRVSNPGEVSIVQTRHPDIVKFSLNIQSSIIKRKKKNPSLTTYLFL